MKGSKQAVSVSRDGTDVIPRLSQCELTRSSSGSTEEHTWVTVTEAAKAVYQTVEPHSQTSQTPQTLSWQKETAGDQCFKA